MIAEKTGIPGGQGRSSPVLPVGPLHRGGPAPRYGRRSAPDEPVPWVPGEHGFRFFPGFYRHVVDTMARIPSTDGVTAAGPPRPDRPLRLTQYDKPTFHLPDAVPARRRPTSARRSAPCWPGFSPIADLTPDDLAHFGARIWQILTSCEERRLAEYEQIPWWSSSTRSALSRAYQKILAAGITRSLVAAHAETASTRTIGDDLHPAASGHRRPPGGDRATACSTGRRTRCGSTRGCSTCGRWASRYLPETAVTEIICAGGRISGVRVQSGRRHRRRCGRPLRVRATGRTSGAPAHPDAPALPIPALAGVHQLAATLPGVDERHPVLPPPPRAAWCAGT